MEKPKIIHQIWVGNEIPEDILENTKQIQELNPEFEYRLYRNEIVYEFNMENIKFTKIAFLVDILRLKILQKYGGIYIDCDVIPQKPLIEYFNKNNNFIDYHIYIDFIKDTWPSGSVIISDKNIHINGIEKNFTYDRPISSLLYNYLKPKPLYCKDVGIDGEYLKDLRMNSWVPKKGEVSKFITLEEFLDQ